MTTINLKDFYYWYTQDQFIEVSDEVAEVFVADARHEMAYQRRLSRHKAQYSLDCDDGIEYSACLHPALVAFTKHQNIDQLSRELLVELIDHIKVYENGNISVRFKFADEFRRIAEYIEINTTKPAVAG